MFTLKRVLVTLDSLKRTKTVQRQKRLLTYGYNRFDTHANVCLSCSFNVKYYTPGVWMRCGQQLQLCFWSSRRQCSTQNDTFLSEEQCNMLNPTMHFIFLVNGWLTACLLYEQLHCSPSQRMIIKQHLCGTSLTQCRTDWDWPEVKVQMLTNVPSLSLPPPSHPSLLVLGRFPIQSQSHRAPTLQHKLDFWKFPCHTAGWTGLNVEI